MKILIVVTNVDAYASGKFKTGLWLGEFTHFYHHARERGVEVVMASPRGGNTPIDPESLKPLLLDKLSQAYLADEAFLNLLKHTQSLSEVGRERFDCLYLTGGHGTMYDFPDDSVLQEIIREHFEDGKVVAAVCHGVCGLLNVRLSNGEYLVNNRELSGYSWFEEILARRKKEVPFNLEEQLEKRGAKYHKALLPLTSNVREDGNLMTGQNPFSSKALAKKVMRRLAKTGETSATPK